MQSIITAIKAKQTRYRKSAIRFGYILLSVFILIVFAFGGNVDAASISYDVKVMVNDQPIPSNIKPYIKADRTYVPIRFISESLGASVAWNQQLRQVHISNQQQTVELTIGEMTAWVNGEAHRLDAPAELVNGATMVPLNFVSGSLGVRVEWQNATKTVHLNTPPVYTYDPVIWQGEDPIVIEGSNGQGEELRAVWIATVYNIDWPSKGGLAIETQKQEFVDTLDALQEIGINAVFVQVRAASDAIYPSKYVPWAVSLTGVQGQDPGYDPLTFMIEEAHKRNMQFHAWFNPFRAHTATDTAKLAADHPAKLHPEWVVKHDNKLIYDPGIPEVRQHVIESIIEVVENYNVDGVHLDDYFYPSSSFPDEKTFATYKGNFTNRDDWRRENINMFVKELNDNIKAKKANVTFGISPFGIWRNLKQDPTGSDTNGNSAYDSHYADARTWIQNRWIDYIAPQLYWSIGYKIADYEKLVNWWVNETKGTDVKLLIGHAVYRVGEKETDWNCNEIINQLYLNQNYSEVEGSVFYSVKYLKNNTVGIGDELRRFYLTDI